MRLPSGRMLALAAIRSVYWRNYFGVGGPELPDADQAWIASNDSRSLLESLLQLLPVRWVNGWQRETESFADTLERFRVLRESTLRLFRGTPEGDLRRYGNHTERGVQTAGDYLIILAGHDINHLSQIEAIRAAY